MWFEKESDTLTGGRAPTTGEAFYSPGEFSDPHID